MLYDAFLRQIEVEQVHRASVQELENMNRRTTERSFEPRRTKPHLKRETRAFRVGMLESRLDPVRSADGRGLRLRSSLHLLSALLIIGAFCALLIPAEILVVTIALSVYAGHRLSRSSRRRSARAGEQS